LLTLAKGALAILVANAADIPQATVLFIPLPVVCWWLGAPGVLVAYGIGLPCLVGITDFIQRKGFWG